MLYEELESESLDCLGTSLDVFDSDDTEYIGLGDKFKLICFWIDRRHMNLVPSSVFDTSFSNHASLLRKLVIRAIAGNCTDFHNLYSRRPIAILAELLSKYFQGRDAENTSSSIT